MAVNNSLFLPDTGTDEVSSLRGSLEGSRPSVLPYLEASKPYSFENIVKAKMPAKELNRSENLVRDTLPDSMMELQASRIENNELFSGWASQSVRNAALARDDSEKLAPVFDSISNWRVARSAAPEPGLLDKYINLQSDIFAKQRGIAESTAKTIGRFPGHASKMGHDTLALGAGTAAEIVTAQPSQIGARHSSLFYTPVKVEPTNTAKQVREWLLTVRDFEIENSRLSSS